MLGLSQGESGNHASVKQQRSFGLGPYLAALLLLAAGTEFALRGPIRGLTAGAQFNDFLSPYIQSKAWVAGADPYSPQTLLQFWPEGAARFEFLSREVADGSIVEKRGIPTAYTPAALLLLTPLTLLSWPAANLLWLSSNVLLTLGMISALAGLAGLEARDWRIWIFAALALALAPFHTGIATGNPAIAAAALGTIAVWAAQRHREMGGGILMALAVILKPQLGLCFLGYWLLTRRWRSSGIAVALILAATGLAVVRLEVSRAAWWASYLRDSHTLLVSGILSDFTPRNPTRFGLINLQVGLYPLIGGRAGANQIALLLFVLLGAVWLFLFFSRRWGTSLSLLPLSAMAVLSLLPIYHRFYDAVLLALPLAWCFSSPAATSKTRNVVLLLFAPFLVPGGPWLETLRDHGTLPSALAGSTWWNALVMPHEVWMLLGLSLMLLGEMSLGTRGGRDAPQTAAGTAALHCDSPG